MQELVDVAHDGCLARQIFQSVDVGQLTIRIVAVDCFDRRSRPVQLVEYRIDFARRANDVLDALSARVFESLTYKIVERIGDGHPDLRLVDIYRQRARREQKRILDVGKLRFFGRECGAIGFFDRQHFLTRVDQIGLGQ